MNRYTSCILHSRTPQIVHTLNDSNLRRSRPLRRSVSNLLRYSCRSVPQSMPGTPKTKSRACYSLRGPTIWRERSTVFTSVRRMRQAFTGPHLSRPRPYGIRASRALVPSLTLLQRFLVGDSDFRYFEDGRHFEDGSCHTTFFTSLIVTPWAAPPMFHAKLEQVFRKNALTRG